MVAKNEKARIDRQFPHVECDTPPSFDDVIDEVVGEELVDVAVLVVFRVVVSSMEGFKDGDEDSNI